MRTSTLPLDALMVMSSSGVQLLTQIGYLHLKTLTKRILGQLKPKLPENPSLNQRLKSQMRAKMVRDQMGKVRDQMGMKSQKRRRLKLK